MLTLMPSQTWQYSVPERQVYMSGILVGQYLVLPNRSSEPPSGIRLDVYALPSVDGDLTLLGSFETPPEVHAVYLQRMPLTTFSPGRMIRPTQDLFRMFSSTSNASVVISIAALLSATSPSPDDAGNPPALPWDIWGPVGTRNAHGWCPVETIGAHVLLRSGAILDFNQYDLAHNLYGANRTSVPSVIHEGPAIIITSAGRRIGSGLRYRETPISLPKCGDRDVMSLIERDDGPKVRVLASLFVVPIADGLNTQIIRLEVASDGAPKFLHYYSL